MPADSFGSLATLRVADTEYAVHRLDALERAGVGHVARLPVSLKILLENRLRREDGRSGHPPRPRHGVQALHRP